MSNIYSPREGRPSLRMLSQWRTGRFYSRTHRILIAYERAAGCSVFIVDEYSQFADTVSREQKLPFCGLCKKFRWNSMEGGPPCAAMHQKAIEESCRLGGSYIYMCELGFVFWTSPLYMGGRYGGSLVAGNSLGIKKEEAAARIRECYGNGLSGEQIRQYLEMIPERNYEETKALVQMMLICARQISDTGQDYGETRRRSAEKTGQPGINQEIRAENRQAWAAREPYAKSPPVSGDAPGILEVERRLLAALRRGDSAVAGKMLDSILAIFSAMSPGDFEFFQFRAIELIVFLSRAVPGNSQTDDAVLEANNRYLKKIAESSSVGELKERLHIIVERMAGKIFSFQGIRHASALRKAEGYIRENYTRKLSLEEIAGVSGLSAPYFSTIFREEMGENLSAYLNRLRVEKAAGLLTEGKTALHQIAEACGFEDQSWFSKIFKNYMGISPGRYREQGGNPEQYTR